MRQEPDFGRHAPRWKECLDRYGYASATITKYRRAAEKQFDRIKQREARPEIH